MTTNKHPLDYLFEPRSIAIVGASGDPSKFGHIAGKGITDRGYDGRVYFVNPKRRELFGQKTFASVKDIPERVDLAFIIIPAERVLPAVQESVEAGARSMVIISAGFGEVNAEGKKLQDEINRLCKEAGIPMVGPNCMGICNFQKKLALSMSPIPPCEPGFISFISQSGTYGIQTMNAAIKMGIPFGKFVSSGNEANLRFPDYLEYLGQDPDTRVIMGYVESAKDGRKFVEVAKDVSTRKPIVIMKLGRTGAGTRAAASHTGSLAGSYAVYRGAFRQSGVIEVTRTDDLINVAKVMVTQPLPEGRNVGIVTLGGGFGVAASDFLVEQGLEVPELSKETQARIREQCDLFTFASAKNPIDLASDMRLDVFLGSVESLLGQDNIDGVIAAIPIMLSAFSELSLPYTAHEYVDKFELMLEKFGKPLLLCCLGAEEWQKLSPNLVFYDTPEEAGKAMAALVEYSQFRKLHAA